MKESGATIAAITCLLISACATYDGNDAAELERTWDAGELHVPLAPELGPSGKAGRRIYRLGDKQAIVHLSEAFKDKKLPAVLYMHGCSGVTPGSIADAKLLAEAGYVVLVPDSFGRRHKPQSCDAATQTGGFHRSVLGWRHEEARYALKRLPDLSFVDTGNLFMMGQSQGGQTVATFPDGNFRGRIITGWHCGGGSPEYEGLRFPSSQPVLSIVGKDDPWFRRSMWGGDCGKHMHSFKDAKAVMIDAPMHHVNSLPEAEKEILTFLRRLTRPESRAGAPEN